MWNRLKYDREVEKQSLRESISPGEYWLSTPKEEHCFQQNPSVLIQQDKSARNIDVESELFGRTRRATKCSQHQYIPKQPLGGCDSQQQQYQGRECYLPTECSRLLNCPPRGVELNRFQPLYFNPQHGLMMPYSMNTRLYIKDHHKPKVTFPKINSIV